MNQEAVTEQGRNQGNRAHIRSVQPSNRQPNRLEWPLREMSIIKFRPRNMSMGKNDSLHSISSVKLERIVLSLLSAIKREHQDWGVEALEEYVGTALGQDFFDIAVFAGFKPIADQATPGSGYGNAAFGKSRYGRCKSFSDGRAAVKRTVSSVGQFCYRGQAYNIGSSCSGQQIQVLEEERRLIIWSPTEGQISLDKRVERTS